ncbi:MAG: hypothetical protein DME45_12335 [Verrucomicrobia bacterium]|nr:MAG: hypothetical protein DME45_12335 [Verrucomicrobiota bacterium]
MSNSTVKEFLGLTTVCLPFPIVIRNASTTAPHLLRAQRNHRLDPASSARRNPTKLNIEVLAPMPSAMETMASAAKPGRLMSWRKPKRISCRSFSISAQGFAL